MPRVPWPFRIVQLSAVDAGAVGDRVAPGECHPQGRGVGDIGGHHRHPFWEQRALRWVSPADHDDIVAGRDQALRQVAPNEARAAGDRDLHAVASR